MDGSGCGRRPYRFRGNKVEWPQKTGPSGDGDRSSFQSRCGLSIQVTYVVWRLHPKLGLLIQGPYKTEMVTAHQIPQTQSDPKGFHGNPTARQSPPIVPRNLSGCHGAKRGGKPAHTWLLDEGRLVVSRYNKLEEKNTALQHHPYRWAMRHLMIWLPAFFVGSTTPRWKTIKAGERIVKDLRR